LGVDTVIDKVLREDRSDGFRPLSLEEDLQVLPVRDFAQIPSDAELVPVLGVCGIICRLVELPDAFD
jgi:hypothetical protein